MPRYDYSCMQCDNDIEVTHGINDTPVVMCEQCGYARVKAFSATPAIFKGSGWGKG